MNSTRCTWNYDVITVETLYETRYPLSLKTLISIRNALNVYVSISTISLSFNISQVLFVADMMDILELADLLPLSQVEAVFISRA